MPNMRAADRPWLSLHSSYGGEAGGRPLNSTLRAKDEGAMPGSRKQPIPTVRCEDCDSTNY
jgi:hypothetical protein